MSMAIAHLPERKDDVIHVKGGMMAISHLLKRKEDGHLQPTEWKGGCQGACNLFKWEEDDNLPSTEGKEDGHLPSIPKEG